MRKIAITLLCALIGVSLMTSCLGSGDEVAKSSSVALLSFSIGDLKTKHTVQKADGTDSTYTTSISGSTILFTIDQANHLVYNVDSLPYNTNVKQVLVNVKTDGGVCYLKPDGEAGSVEDSINFTQPVTFRVTSYDEQFRRDYKVSVNVHQVDPGKTEWKQLDYVDQPALSEQKAFVKDGCLYVIGLGADSMYYTATLTDASTWTTTACVGIEGNSLAVLLMGEVFYLKTDAGLYCSEDAIEWEAVSNDSEVGTLPGEGISRAVAWFSQQLKTNKNIMRSTFVAIPEEADTCAQVWTKLSTEENWVEIEPKGTNIYGCPNLEDLALILYADKMYAFGGKSVGNRKVPLEAFSACYESRDNGVTWKVNDTALSLPEEFEGRDEAFTATTDGEYVWVIWSNGEVWRGRWNGVK